MTVTATQVRVWFDQKVIEKLLLDAVTKDGERQFRHASYVARQIFTSIPYPSPDERKSNSNRVAAAIKRFAVLYPGAIEVQTRENKAYRLTDDGIDWALEFTGA